jgi:hypothetical protein
MHRVLGLTPSTKKEGEERARNRRKRVRRRGREVVLVKCGGAEGLALPGPPEPSAGYQASAGTG